MTDILRRRRGISYGAPIESGQCMRALKVTLRASKPITLPLAYNELLQGLIYNCWRESFGGVHDSISSEGKQFRHFTFGPLIGKAHPDGNARTIRFYDFMSFELRSPHEVLLDELALRLCSKDAIAIGAYDNLKLVNLQCCDRLFFPRQVVLRAKSPIVALKTLSDGHTRPYSPNDSEWLLFMQNNLASKARDLAVECEPALAIIPRVETLRKRVTKFKGTYVTGWTGDFFMAADPTAISLLYYDGLGVKNPQGFGMFDILDATP